MEKSNIKANVEESISIQYNKNLYLLVYSAEIDGEIIYHFINYKMIDFLIDEKNWTTEDKDIPNFSLFCKKENCIFVPIKDKRKEEIFLQEFGMTQENIIPISGRIVLFCGDKIFMPRAKKVKSEDRLRFIQEQKENYRDIKTKLGIDIDLDRIEKRLDKIKINIVEGKLPYNWDAFYRPKKNDINIRGEDINKNELSSKRIRLHETNHYIAGKRYSYMNRLNKGILEGANENLVTDYYDDNTSSFIQIPIYQSDKEKNHRARVQYNFMQGTTYQHFVSIVKQLEYVTGMKSYESAIKGNNKFFIAIVKALGIEATLKLCVIENLMKASSQIENLENLKTLQNLIMHASFDKQFSNIQSAQDAKTYLQKLRGLEKFRGRITYINKDGGITKDNTYKEYYISQFEQLQDRYGALEEYRYEEQELKPTFDEKEDEIKKTIKEKLLTYLLYQHNCDKSKVAKKVDIDIVGTGATWTIISVNGEETKEGINNIGEKNRFLFSSISYKEKEYKTAMDKFMKAIGAEQTKMSIEYTDEEIQKKYEEFQHNKEKARKELETNLKKPTLADKIRKMLFQGLFKKKTKNQDIPENVERVKKSPSWNLNNWSAYHSNQTDKNLEKTNPEAQSKEDEEIDIE